LSLFNFVEEGEISKGCNRALGKLREILCEYLAEGVKVMFKAWFDNFYENYF
jgi:hypothetical protein